MEANTEKKKEKRVLTPVKQIKEKPGKRWDNTVEKVLMLVIAGVVAWMLGQIGL